ncbi:MAG: hypothetical protein AAGK02_00425 [Pseudomonadota bacterium]
MSFSNDFVDKSSSSIVPEFAGATQISEREQLRIDIAALADPNARANAEGQYAYADVQTRQMRIHYAQRETRFVDANLKLEPEISLTIGDDTRSYEQEVEKLRRDFARSPHGQALRDSIVLRETNLWDRVKATVARAKREADRKTPDKAPTQKRSLRRAFKRAHDR